MCGLIEFTVSTTSLHIFLHGHRFAHGPIEVIVVDVVKYLILPATVECAGVIIFKQVVAVVTYCFVECLLVILVKCDTHVLQQLVAK